MCIFWYILVYFVYFKQYSTSAMWKRASLASLWNCISHLAKSHCLWLHSLFPSLEHPEQLQCWERKAVTSNISSNVCPECGHSWRWEGILQVVCAQPVPANPVSVGGRFRGKIPNQQFNQDCCKPFHLPAFDSSFPDETTVYMRRKKDLQNQNIVVLAGFFPGAKYQEA